MTDYDILANKFTFSRLSCKTTAYDQSKSYETIRYGTISRLGLFVKEDRETGKVVRKLCLFMRQSRSVHLDSRGLCDFVAR